MKLLVSVSLAALAITGVAATPAIAQTAVPAASATPTAAEADAMYARAIGIFEMKSYVVREDLDQWLPLIGWLTQRRALEIAPGSPAITSSLVSSAITPTAALAT